MSPSANDFSQASVVYGNLPDRNHIPLRDIEQTEDGYLALNTVPSRRPVNTEHGDIVEPHKEPKGKTADPFDSELDGSALSTLPCKRPLNTEHVEAVIESRKQPEDKTEKPYYLELDGLAESDNTFLNPQKTVMSDESFYTALTPESPAEKQEGSPESCDIKTDATAYFTVEENGNSMGTAQYSIPPSTESGPVMPDHLRKDSNADEHYYSYADPPKILGDNKDSLYFYADCPRSSCANVSGNDDDEDEIPNTSYFMIEERSNSMGTPVYHTGGDAETQTTLLKKEAKERGQAERIDENIYTYADPAGLDVGSLKNKETEGWEDNILYVPGSPDV